MSMSALEIQTTVMQLLFAPIRKDLSSAHAWMGSRGMESPAQVSAVSFPYSLVPRHGKAERAPGVYCMRMRVNFQEILETVSLTNISV